jgi:hypothetical protein
MKVLNVDSLAEPQKTVVIKDVRHKVKEMTVEDFIAVVTAAERFENEKGTLLERFNESLNAIKRALPTISEEDLKSLTVLQVGAINLFLRDEFVEEAESMISEEEIAEAGK